MPIPMLINYFSIRYISPDLIVRLRNEKHNIQGYNTISPVNCHTGDAWHSILGNSSKCQLLYMALCIPFQDKNLF